MVACKSGSVELTSIEKDAFEGCTTIVKVSIGYSVTKIEQNTFAGCTNLTSVTFEKAGINITDDSFPGASSLKTVYLGIETYTRTSGGNTWAKQ
jgi:hypothetical protein